MLAKTKIVEYVYLRVNVQMTTYKYSYSFDGVDWKEIPVTFESYKLSDDYIKSNAAFTGAFVGMHCRDGSGQNNYADFDYFLYKEL